MTLTRTDIRAAAFEDAARLGRVHVETWRAAYCGILADDYLDSMSDIRHAAYWARILDDADRGAGTFIAESAQDGIVGFADCEPERAGPPGFGEVMALYLLPAWQHRGTGRRLVRALRGPPRRRGVQRARDLDLARQSGARLLRRARRHAGRDATDSDRRRDHGRTVLPLARPPRPFAVTAELPLSRPPPSAQVAP